MSANVDLTVVIATFNGAAFIESAITSALEARPLRVIVADDASTDDTVAIVTRIMRAEPALELLKGQANVGVSRNWNRAIRGVATEYCLKLDHDDKIVPAYVDLALAYLRAHPSVGIIAAMDQGGQPADRAPSETMQQGPGDIREYSGDAACAFVLRWDPYACSSSTIYRKAAWDSVDGFDERLNYCNDREIWFRLAASWHIAFHFGIGAIRRLHAGNFTEVVRAQQKISVEYDHMFRQALKIWPARSLRALFAKSFLVVARGHLGSARRLATIAPAAVPRRLVSGARAFFLALRLRIAR